MPDNLNPTEAAAVAKLDIVIRKKTDERRKIKQGANHRAFRERRREAGAYKGDAECES